MKVKDVDDLDENWQKVFCQNACLQKMASQGPAVYSQT